MKYTKEQLDRMQKCIVGKLKMMKNHSYPQEEADLSLILVMIADQRIDTDNVQIAKGDEDGLD